jgi:hypothetical protein
MLCLSEPPSRLDVGPQVKRSMVTRPAEGRAALIGDGVSPPGSSAEMAEYHRFNRDPKTIVQVPDQVGLGGSVALHCCSPTLHQIH